MDRVKIDLINELVKRFWSFYVSMPGKGNENFGKFVLVHEKNSNAIIDRKFGTMDGETAERIDKEVYTKAKRLIDHPQLISTSQIGLVGAIRAGEYIFSLQGPSVLGAEAIIALTAFRQGFLNKDQLAEIQHVSGNSCILEILAVEEKSQPHYKV